MFTRIVECHVKPEKKALSFWNSKQDAERYHQEHFKRIAEILKPHLRRDPSVETYSVDTSTTHRIAAGKKAA